MFQFPPYTQGGVLPASERVCDIGLANGHAAAFAKATVEAVGNRAAAGVRHEGFEANEFVSDPARFGQCVGISLSCNPAP